MQAPLTRRLASGDRIVLASHNPGKLREIEILLAPFGIDVVSAGALGLPEPVEDALSFSGNARIKAHAAAAASGLPALSDDSGFCVAALDGSPGVLSARWAGPAKDFSVAIDRVARELGDATDLRAWFVCALCLAWPDEFLATFVGRVDGTAGLPARGTLGFGYDPIFTPAGDTRRYSEFPPDEKAASSHRGRAFAQLRAACLPISLPT